MTKEEAINKLIRIRQVQGSKSEAHEALGMAIDALAYQAELPEGLEEAAEKYFYSRWSDGSLDIKDDVIADFIAGAKHQRKQDQSLIELAEDHAMLAGMNKMKEQMMEKAVAVEVVGDKRDLRLIDSTERCLFNAKRGDWLKAIIIPEK